MDRSELSKAESSNVSNKKLEESLALVPFGRNHYKIATSSAAIISKSTVQSTAIRNVNAQMKNRVGVLIFPTKDRGVKSGNHYYAPYKDWRTISYPEMHGEHWVSSSIDISNVQLDGSNLGDNDDNWPQLPLLKGIGISLRYRTTEQGPEEVRGMENMFAEIMSIDPDNPGKRIDPIYGGIIVVRMDGDNDKPLSCKDVQALWDLVHSCVGIPEKSHPQLLPSWVYQFNVILLMSEGTEDRECWVSDHKNLFDKIREELSGRDEPGFAQWWLQWKKLYAKVDPKEYESCKCPVRQGGCIPQ